MKIKFETSIKTDESIFTVIHNEKEVLRLNMKGNFEFNFKDFPGMKANDFAEKFCMVLATSVYEENEPLFIRVCKKIYNDKINILKKILLDFIENHINRLASFININNPMYLREIQKIDKYKKQIKEL